VGFRRGRSFGPGETSTHNLEDEESALPCRVNGGVGSSRVANVYVFTNTWPPSSNPALSVNHALLLEIASAAAVARPTALRRVTGASEIGRNDWAWTSKSLARRNKSQDRAQATNQCGVKTLSAALNVTVPGIQ